jgi:predicted unusual protein kinase regulating ubiquinone biosynthesis (AarF/ABC1/UbiB family)
LADGADHDGVAVKQKAPATSAVRRLVRLGGLVGRVGASVAGGRIASLARSGERREELRLENLVRNARRIAATLGELKGAAMKVGQMLSLQDSILPPEVAEVLRSLQKQSPPMPFEVVEDELDVELPAWRETFATFESEAFAAASIGQVHRGVLRDGRQVAVKIQYPLIDRIVEADLTNLRRVLQTLVSLVTDIDFEPIWKELRDRLNEELDYLHEADNARRMADLYRTVPEVVIPGVIAEATTRHVLTMEYVAGMSPDEACGAGAGQELRDRWGSVLFELLLRGLLEHRLLHADPNLANFSFLPGGRVVVYDFGCVKEVPAGIARGYRDVTRAALAGRRDEIPALLDAMGVGAASGGPLSADLIAPVVDVVMAMLDGDRPYRFGDDDRVFHRMMELKSTHFGEVTDLRFPPHIVFINRTVVGHFGNLSRLRAAAPWREILEAHVAGRRKARGERR